MGCTTSKTTDKDDDAPYSKSSDKKPNADIHVAAAPKNPPSTATSPQNAPGNASSSAAESSSSKKKPEEQHKPSKNKTHNKKKEWGNAGERRAHQNQYTRTQMENFPTGTEKQLKELIEKGLKEGRNKEFYENAEAGGWKVSHIGDDGMVYLENKNNKQKGHKTHLSDIKMPPPPDVPYHPSPTGERNEDAEGGVRPENIDIDMGPRTQHADAQHLSMYQNQQGADLSHGQESHHTVGSTHSNHQEGQAGREDRENASFGDDDVAVRIEYINKDAVSKDFISGNDQRDNVNDYQSEDEQIQNTMNYHLQNKMETSNKSQPSPGADRNNEEMSGNFVQNASPFEGFRHNEDSPFSYSHDHMEPQSSPYDQIEMSTFKGNKIQAVRTPDEPMHSSSYQQNVFNEPSVQLGEDNLQQTMVSSSSEFIAAIDLGYAFSGFAFLDLNKPSQVEVNRNWASHLGYTSHKTPTALLFNSKEVVQAFGYQAYEQYDQLIGDDEGNMLLYKLVHSFKEKPLDKVKWKLISTSMQYLKAECESVISQRYNIDPKKASVSWTIPFPLDWDSRDTMSTFKDHMYKAGFQKSTTSWIPDVECALHYCVTTTNFDLSEGKQCILISAGESSVLHYVYQYSKKKGWSCVYKAHSMGGKDFNRLFTRFLGIIFGDNFIAELQRVHPSEWYSFINMFDLAKRDITTGMQLQVNYAFENFHREFTGGKTIKDAIHQKSKETGPSVSLTKSGGLKFRHGTLIMLFDSVLRDIENKVKNVVEKYPKAETVYVVGGLSDCAWVKERIQSGAKGRKVIIPEEPNLCVLKGAVLKGFAKMEK